jgi:hypothetical protein
MTVQDVENAVAVLRRRGMNTGPGVSEVMNAMTSLQRILIPKHQSLFLAALPSILDSLLAVCDDKDVSIRHTAGVVLSSSSSVILPFQKSIILSFLAARGKKAFRPHALIAILEMQVKVTIFLTPQPHYIINHRNRTERS